MTAGTIRKILSIALPAALAAGTCGAAFAAGIQGTYTDWFEPSWPENGFTTLQGTIAPINEPVADTGQVEPAYFYAMQFHYFDGLGAYIGIQTRPDGASWASSRSGRPTRRRARTSPERSASRSRAKARATRR
jgi:hypothetical protein